MAKRPAEAAKRRAVVTSIRIDPGVKAELEEIAEADGRSLSGLIQKIVADWLRARRRPRKP
jgi:predicted transcriptional regulator